MDNLTGYMILMKIESIVMWLVAIIAIVFVFKSVYLKSILPRRKIEDAKRTPEIRAQATLVAKSMEVRPYLKGSTSVPFLVFELANGTRKDFRVDSTVYNTIMEGEEGTLTYHELNDARAFVSFQRER